MNRPLAYNRIKVVAIIDPELDDSPDEIKDFHPELMQELLNKQFRFVDEFYNKICQKIGKSGWHINFIKVNQYHNRFLVDIYLDDRSQYISIVSIINTLKDGYDFRPYLRNFIDLNA